MGTDRTPRDIRGFLLPWPFSKSHIWNGESTATQQGPHAGIAEAQGDYDLVLQSTGDMSADANVTIKTQKAGHVGNSKFVWKHGNDTLFYGRDGANVLSYWEIVDASTSNTDYHDISAALGLPSGEALALVRERITGVNYRAKIYHRSKTGGYTSIVLHTQNNDKPMHGGLCLLPNGDILAAHYVADATTNRAQVYIHRSQTNGLTWSLVSSEALPDFIDIAGAFGAGNSGYDLGRLRIAYAQGQILLCCGLLAHNTTPANGDIIGQYASTDNGGSFVQVAFTDGGTGFYSFDLLVKNDNFYLTYIATNNNAKILPLSHAFVSIDAVRSYGTEYNIVTGGITIAGGLTNKHWTTGQMSCWSDEDGRFWASVEDLDHNLISAILSDNTENWYFLGGNGAISTTFEDARWYAIGSANTMITAHAGCSASGRQIVFHNFEGQGATTTYRASICAAMLGGYSAVTMPQMSTYPNSYDYAGWQFTWVPFDLPNDTGHYTQSGAGSAILGSGKITISASSTQTKYYESPSLSSGTPIIIRARLKPTAEGTLSGGRGLEYRTTAYWASVFIQNNQLALYDMHATSQIGSAFSFSTFGEIDILFAMDDANVYLWAMEASKTEKQWVLVANTSSLSTGAVIGSARIRFGVITSLIMGGGASLDTEWYEFHYANGASTGDGLHTGQINPTELKGRLYPPQSQFDYITNGMRISTIEGPAYEGDEYNVTTAFDYPIEHIFYASSPSPKNKWRSLSVTTGAVPEQKISMFLDVDIGSNDDTLFGNDLVGFAFTGINWRQFDIHRYDKASTSWVSIGSFSNHAFTGTFNRIGASIIGNDANGPYFQFEECKDWYVILQSGETTIVRKIRSNTEGVFNNSSSSKKCVLQIDTPAHTDPASGTIWIVPNACTVLADIQANGSTAIRLTIASQITAEKYIMMGNACIGPVIIPAHQYGRGRTISFDSNVAIDIAPDGTQRTRDLQAQGRTYRLAWAEGVDIQDLYVTNASPDYYKATTGAASYPIAAVGSAPTAMMGVIRYVQGPKSALVYLPKITPMINPTKTMILNRRMEHALCTLDGPISIENVLGDELRSDGGEVMRVGTLQLREVR